MTARVLTDHFERVVVVDPEIHDDDKPKTQIMQYNAGQGEQTHTTNWPLTLVVASVPESVHPRRPSVVAQF